MSGGSLTGPSSMPNCPLSKVLTYKKFNLLIKFAILVSPKEIIVSVVALHGEARPMDTDSSTHAQTSSSASLQP